jgi:hypothetical protein
LQTHRKAAPNTIFRREFWKLHIETNRRRFRSFNRAARIAFVCVANTAACRTIPGMNERFEIRLAPERRQELAALAADVGISASDLARLAILRLLNSRDALVHLSPDNNHGRAA